MLLYQWFELNEEQGETLHKLVDMLEESEDVQDVHHNFKVGD